MVLSIGSTSEIQVYNAETGIMVIRSVAMFSVARRYWKWNAIQTWLVWGALIAVNGALLVASSLKFLEGGFIPLGIGVVSSSSWQPGAAQGDLRRL